MELYYNPLSRSCQKVLLALYEKQANFFPRIVHLDDPIERIEFKEFYPLCQLPLLQTTTKQLIPESSIIIEYIDLKIMGGTTLMPLEQPLNLDNKMLDRMIDNQLYRALHDIETQQLLPEQMQQPLLLKKQEKRIRLVLNELETRLANNHWLCGDSFTLADCALIPALASMPRNIKLMEYVEINRYWHQALQRGSWQLVQDEVTDAKLSTHTGIQPQP